MSNLVRSWKLSRVEPGLYMDDRPLELEAWLREEQHIECLMKNKRNFVNSATCITHVLVCNVVFFKALMLHGSGDYKGRVFIIFNIFNILTLGVVSRLNLFCLFKFISHNYLSLKLTIDEPSQS